MPEQMVHAMALLIFLQCPRAIVSYVKSYAQLWEERRVNGRSMVLLFSFFSFAKETSKFENALKFQLVKLITYFFPHKNGCHVRANTKNASIKRKISAQRMEMTNPLNEQYIINHTFPTNFFRL